jgi:hypothetical protein
MSSSAAQGFDVEKEATHSDPLEGLSFSSSDDDINPNLDIVSEISLGNNNR